MTQTTDILEAITLRVLADAPDSRGPFVLEVQEHLGYEQMINIQRAWTQAFEKAERPVPALMILGKGMRLRAATVNEVDHA